MDSANCKRFIENPFFFDGHGKQYRLYGVDYLPIQSIGIGYVFLQPIGTERNVIDAVQVNLARILATHGIRCIRFDYFGTGDSDGIFENINRETLMNDISSTISYIASDENCAHIGLFGVRFGALLAGHYADMNRKMINSLILCAPVVNALTYIKNELRQSMSTQTVLFRKIIMNRDQIINNLIDGKNTEIDGYNLSNMNGFPLTRDFFLTLKDLDLLSGERLFKNKVYIVNLDNVKRKVIKDVDNLMEKYKGSECLESAVIVEKSLPWIHGNTLYKEIPSLNDKILKWIIETDGKSNSI